MSLSFNSSSSSLFESLDNDLGIAHRPGRCISDYMTTRVITVWMPNQQAVGSQPWTNFRTSVDAIESMTGLDFFSNVPQPVQSIIESTVDMQKVAEIFLYPAF